MKYLPVTVHNRQQINTFISQRWFSTQMIIYGETVDMTRVDGVVAMESDEIIGLITYRIRDAICEITSLDALWEGQGIGTALLET